MFQEYFRTDFNGMAAGRVARDEDFTRPLGFLRNEYNIHYIYGGERYFFMEGHSYKMDAGCLAFVDKRLLPKTCIIGGSYHDRLLIEIQENFLGGGGSEPGF